MKNHLPFTYRRKTYGFGSANGHFFLILLALLIHTGLSAQLGNPCAPSQNLVMNGCFDSFTACPQWPDQTSRGQYWYSFSGGMPDYLNGCSSNIPGNVDVPQVDPLGNQYEHTVFNGTHGMMRIRCFTNGSNQRDYLYQPVVLGPGKYYAEMYVNLKNSSMYGTSIGMLFTPVSLSPPPGDAPYVMPLTPPGPFINSPTVCHAWTQVSGCFTTASTLYNLYIGNFGNDPTFLPFCMSSGTPTDPISHYFVDDVYVEPILSQAGASKVITCGQSTVIGTPLASPGKMTYSWISSPAGSYPATPTIIVTPTITTVYTLVVTAPGGCGSSQSTVTVTVNPNPTLVTCSPCTLTTCYGTSSFSLYGGIPTGGVYSGPFVNSVTSIFDPNAAGPGTHTIMYSYTSAIGCTGSKIMTLTVPGSCDWAWQTWGSASSNNFAHAIATEKISGDVYITGSILERCDFGNGIILTANGVGDFFIAKYNNCGIAQWAERSVSADFSEGLGITVDGLGNAYVTGRFKNKFNVGPYSLGTTPSTTEDIFIAKYDKTGAVLWACQGGGPADDAGKAIALNATGSEFYVTGYIEGSAAIGCTPTPMPFPVINTFRNVFVTRHSATTGTVITAHNYTATGTSISSSGNGITVDQASPPNIYVTGEFNNMLVFGGGAIINTAPNGGKQAFLLKTNSTMTPLWARNVFANSPMSGNSWANAVATDASGTPVITGGFEGTELFTGPPNTILGSAGGFDIFTAQYHPSGGNLLWSVREGNNSNDEGRAVCTDMSNNIYTTGYFTKSGGGFALTCKSVGATGGAREVYVNKYNNTGACWMINRTMQFGDLNNDQGNGIAFDGNDNAYLTGSFMGTAAVFTTTWPVTLSTFSGINDIFLKKICNATSGFREEATTSIQKTNNKNILRIFPNPNNGKLSIWIDLERRKDVLVSITDLHGRQVYSANLQSIQNHQEQIDLGSLSNGIYFIYVNGEDIRLNDKIILNK